MLATTSKGSRNTSYENRKNQGIVKNEKTLIRDTWLGWWGVWRRKRKTEIILTFFLLLSHKEIFPKLVKTKEVDILIAQLEALSQW